MAHSTKENTQVLQQERKRALIEATITSIARTGFSNLTLSRIAGHAGLSAGIVNFYFNSKEALLLETLKSVAEEFDHTVYSALDHAGPLPADRLRAIVLASVGAEITQPRKVAVWYAFMSEGHSREDYQQICGHRDQRYFSEIHGLCREIIALPVARPAISASAIAHAICGLIDEFWQDVLFDGAGFDRERAAGQCLEFLASVFPWAYAMPEGERSGQRVPDAAPPVIRARRAVAADLSEVARLFDLYRQFYRQAADRRGAGIFLDERFAEGDSVIFVAEDESGKAHGFVQMYPALCSVAMGRFWVLYDLFVDRGMRGAGTGRALMECAREHALRSGALRIDLETAVDNTAAQALYESLGYVREQQFHKYSLSLC
jgi:AcrR family transcriptional regulator/ribosomal protein S18 acetylase RimI-like enzyme